MDLPSFLGESLSDFLEQISSRTPAPGGGAVAAIAVAMAAGLVGMAARFSGEELPEAHELTRRADALRSRVASLAKADAASYAAVLRALRTSSEPDEAAREHAIHLALSTAADVPMSVAVAAEETSDLAAQLAEGGKSSLKGDAAAGAILAQAATRISAVLVNTNLAGTDDDRIDRAHELHESATAAAERAVTAALSTMPEH